MQVIPVIDVRGGVAVAASRGDRANYRTLLSPLAASADPVAVAQGLRTLFPFPILYVADLEGIEGRGADHAMQRKLCEAWSGAEVWIDDGGDGGDPPTLTLPTRGREPVAQVALDGVPPPLWGRLGGGDSRRTPLTKSGLLDPMIKSHVLGSESLQSLADYDHARLSAGPAAPLSLDFRGDEFVGPRALLEDAALWPDRVIVMTLARVGSGEGPDLARLASIVSRAGQREIYAAGGVRHGDDLRALRDIGVAGALVATALHTGKITAADLEAICQPAA
jgi:phosphoribosylformimino-5-aminoimidazole carboxamide ribotide isomerase